MGLIKATRYTEVEAVNMLLATVDMPSIDSIDTTYPLVEKAVGILNNVFREVISLGLNFSKEVIRLYPDTTGAIIMPEKVVRIANPVKSLNASYFTMRGRKLYDLNRNTTDFSEEGYKQGIDVEVVVAIPFNDMPETAKNYIIKRSARIFQALVQGDGVRYQYTAQEELEAFTAMQRDSNEEGNYNILDGYSGRRPVNRRSNPFPIGGR
ncbi:MAG: hypothetical protein WC981_03770 [Candidatus Dojkabacteria bacterium]